MAAFSYHDHTSYCGHMSYCQSSHGLTILFPLFVILAALDVVVDHQFCRGQLIDAALLQRLQLPPRRRCVPARGSRSHAARVDGVMPCGLMVAALELRHAG